MDAKKIGLGLGAFVAGAAAWVAGVAAFGPRAKGGGQQGSPQRSSGGAATPRVPNDLPATEANQPEVGQANVPHGTVGQPNPAAEHVPTDLMGDHHPGADERAAMPFRPDPTAVPTAEEREALRPATGPAPSLVADRGSGFAEAAGAA